jgi:hypothetical protein
MTPLVKGLVLATLQVSLVASLGAKLLYDRATCPRVWARAVSFDPNAPIRGRYVSLQLEVDAPDLPPPAVVEPARPWLTSGPAVPVTLAVENGRLVARRDAQAPGLYGSTGALGNRDAVTFRQARDQRVFPVLVQPVVFFIPEHVEDPSRRPAGEELWVEVTLPAKGPPRPIRLGVKRGDGPVTPLDLR